MPRKPAKPTTTPMRKGKVRHYSVKWDDLVRDCIDLMVENKWQTGASTLALMKSTGYSRESVNKAACAASRFIRICRGDVREEILRSLDHGKQLAVKAEMIVYDPEAGAFRRTGKPDLAALKSFLQLQTEVHGLTGKASANAQREGNGENVSVPIDELTDLLESLGYEVTKKDDHGESSDSDDSESGDGADGPFAGDDPGDTGRLDAGESEEE